MREFKNSKDSDGTFFERILTPVALKRKEVTKLHNDGVSFEEISDRLSISRFLLDYYLRTSETNKLFRTGAMNRNEVFKLYQKGLPVKSISEQLDLSSSYVYKAIHKIDRLNMNSSSSFKKPGVDHKKVIALLKEGMSQCKVAKELGVGERTVGRIFKSVQPQFDREGVKYYRCKKEVNEELAIALRLKGLTYTEIGAKLNISKSTARKVCQSMQLNMNDKP